MKQLIIVLIGLPILIGGIIIIKILFFPVNTAEKLINTAYDAQEKTLNADNAIYNYEWFKQQNEDINAAKSQLDNSSMAVDNFLSFAGERDNWTFEDKNEYARLNSIKLGLQNYLETLIADYNARAKMANRNIFENSILPNYIDSLTFIKK
jgi:hypothetical protein